jgi:CHAT domain-containing protein
MGDPGNTANLSLIQQATQFYDRGDYSQASQLWQQAIAAYKADSANLLNQAMAWSNLSLTYQQLSQLSEAERAITTSLDLLRYNPKTPNISASADPHYLAILAPSLDIRGRLYWQQGNPQAALTTWQRTAQIYRILGNVHAEVQSQLNQVQALQALGNLTAAHKQLRQVEVMLAQQPSSPLKVEQLRSLGNTHRLMGNLKQAEDALSQALTIASVSEQPVMQMELGNLQWAIANRARQINTKPKRDKAIAKTQQALQHYTQASQSPQLRLQAHLNQLGLLLDAGDFAAADALWQTLKGTMAELPSDRPSLLARLTYAQYLTCLKQRDKKPVPLCSQTAPSPTAAAAPKQLLAIDSLDWVTIAQLLTTSAKQAEKLGDIHTQSYALGTLGTLYELIAQADHATNLTYAIDLTNQALTLAQAHQARDLAYRWLWQRGRLLKQQGDRTGAIAAYEAAVKTLDPVRANLLPAAADVQFDFRDNVEPLYRELVDLLLQPNASEQDIQDAIDYIDALQLAEIEDHLRCNLAQRVQVAKTINPTAAVIHAILLEDRLAVIAKFPNTPPTLHPTAYTTLNVPTVIRDLQKELLRPSGELGVKQEGQRLYNVLIKPLKPVLDSQPQVNTLVFVLDNALRNIPMAVLYDGKQYLIDRYAIALTPGAKLFEPTPTPEKLAMFLGGVNTQPDFSVDNQDIRHGSIQVQEELAKIRQTDIVGQSQQLVDRDFTIDNIRATLSPGKFSAVHIKTHGEFSSDPEATFLQAYQQLITGVELASLLETGSQDRTKPLDLLMLSACKTAQGDDRAVLGLAGIAVRSGARSTISTLWKAQDVPNIDLTDQFYQALSQPGITKAKALQLAQQYLKSNGFRPYIWAPYVLVGSWL